ncbi:MAG: TAXI family TRAP transporter solute-binding subunit [Pseudomonadota bacterium]
MSRRFAALRAVTAIAVLGLSAAAVAADTPRISFQIATGSTSGTFFPVGEAIAGLISHPPGVNRCEAANVCGPAGLIVSARTSDGTVDNLLSVNDGGVESGLAQSDVIAAAIKGAGPFKTKGKQSHVRVIASLFSEEVHLVVSEKAKVKSVADLKGKRVSLGLAGSGVGFTAREILAAYHVPEARLKTVTLDTAGAIALMKQDKLDAFFAVGGVPIEGVGDLLAAHTAKLVPITGPVRDRLVKSEPSLEPATISYPGQETVGTVSTRALWIVRDSVPEGLVYGITRALFNPANRDALSASHPSAREIGLTTAALMPPAPLHPGAARFYADAARAAQR